MITGNKFILLVALLSLLLLFLFIPLLTDKPMIIMMEIIKIVLLITNVNESDPKCNKSIGIFLFLIKKKLFHYKNGWKINKEKKEEVIKP